MSWRLPFILLSCLSFAFAAASAVWLMPSPRWLTLCGRPAEAATTWDLLGVSQAEREKVEMEQSRGAVGVQARGPRAAESHAANREIHSSFRDLFSRDVRGRTALAVFMMGMQQMSGIDGVLYVSPQFPAPSRIHR